MTHRPISTIVFMGTLAAALGLGGCGDEKSAATDTQGASETSGEVTLSETVEDAIAPTEASAEATVSETSEEVAAETTPPPAPNAVFLGGATPGQGIGSGPFPNDSLVVAGHVQIAPLGTDSRFGTLAKPEILARLDAAIATKGRFAFAAAAFLPMEVAPDLASFQGKVYYVSIGGSDLGRSLPAQVEWFAPGRMLVALPAWGAWLLPGSRYALYVAHGVKDALGRILERPEAIDLVAQNDPAWAAFRGSQSVPADWVVATVFQTEESMPFMQALMAATDAFPLVTPTRRVSRDVTSGAWIEASDVVGLGLEAYFGVATLTDGPLAYLPTAWDEGDRAAAATVPGGAAYAGGSLHDGIGYVVNGSFLAPSFAQARQGESADVTALPIQYGDGGKPAMRSRAMVPFSIFFCKDHVASGSLVGDQGIPVAVFTHGGTAIRSDALAFANLNCLRGVATVVADLPFHGGRQSVTYVAGVAGEDVVAPTERDLRNTYTGEAGQDFIGDNGAATSSVGGLFALGSGFDPAVIEANFIQVSVELHTLVRLLREKGPTGMGAAFGVTFDTTTMVHQALSFGTSFSTAALAATSDFDAAVESVGSGMLFSANVMMAPANAELASAVIWNLLGLASSLDDLKRASWADPVIALIAWLHQRGDPAAYAPFVLRGRVDGHALHVLGFGDSWDETLNGPAQLSFANAWGVPVFGAGADWTLDATMPGAATISATPFDAGVAGNLAVGDKNVTAAWFYYARSCHAGIISPLCTSRALPPYPPIVLRDAALVSVSPICQMQNTIAAFLADLTPGHAPNVKAPAGTCADLYGPPAVP